MNGPAKEPIINPPEPLYKRGEALPPFEKGGLSGILE